MRERQPSVIVPIDFGAFNMPQVRFAKRSGQRVAYYFPPSAWRRTGNQGAELAKLADKILVPFDWAETRYRGLGGNAEYVGHPLVERTVSTMTRSDFAAQFGMDASAPIIGLLLEVARTKLAS